MRAARDAGLTADIVAADAHLGYYERRVVHIRIDEDVIAAGTRSGPRRVWLAGISLGGLGCGRHGATSTRRTSTACCSWRPISDPTA